MQIKKETVIFVQTSSGETINIGNTGVSVEDGMVAKVLNIAKHDRAHNTCLALIQNPKTTQVFIININGLKKVER